MLSSGNPNWTSEAKRASSASSSGRSSLISPQQSHGAWRAFNMAWYRSEHNGYFLRTRRFRLYHRGSKRPSKAKFFRRP